MKGYKGFEKGLICKGKQYAENAEFEESGGEIKADTWYMLKDGEFVEVEE